MKPASVLGYSLVDSAGKQVRPPGLFCCVFLPLLQVPLASYKGKVLLIVNVASE